MVIAKKSLGQNFLMHPQIAERIVRAANVPPDTIVLEVGPGTGMLTRALLAAGYPVVAVEADGALVQSLEETFAKEIAEGRLLLAHGDIRTASVSAHLRAMQERGSKSAIRDAARPAYAVVANIPYYITGEIMRLFLTSDEKPQSMTLLVQKEVAERIARTEQRGKEGLLSLSVKAFGTPQYCFTVPRGAFRPAPKVDSAVISIQNIRQDAFPSATAERAFFELLRTGFAHKRKLLRNNLSALYGEARVSAAFEALSIPPKARAEDLTLATWEALAEKLA